MSSFGGNKHTFHIKYFHELINSNQTCSSKPLKLFAVNAASSVSLLSLLLSLSLASYSNSLAAAPMATRVFNLH